MFSICKCGLDCKINRGKKLAQINLQLSEEQRFISVEDSNFISTIYHTGAGGAVINATTILAVLLQLSQTRVSCVGVVSDGPDSIS